MAKKKKTAQKKKVTQKKIMKKKAVQKKAMPKKVTPKKITKKAVKKTTKKKVAAKKITAAPKKAVVHVDYSKAITPLGNRLVVKISSLEKITAGGIIIPQTSTVSGHLRGIVLAVGHGEKSKKGYVRPLDVQKGDEILFSEFSGTKVEFNSEELLIIQESDVLGIIQD